MQATSYTYDPETRTGSVLLDDGTPVDFDAPAFDMRRPAAAASGATGTDRGAGRGCRTADHPGHAADVLSTPEQPAGRAPRGEPGPARV